MVTFFNMEDLLFLARPGFAERSERGLGVLTNGMGLSTYLPGGKTGSRLAQQGTAQPLGADPVGLVTDVSVVGACDNCETLPRASHRGCLSA